MQGWCCRRGSGGILEGSRSEGVVRGGCGGGRMEREDG